MTIIDFNKFQGAGAVQEVLSINAISAVASSIGWNVRDVLGHDIQQIVSTLEMERFNAPTLIIADTVKGKGVSFMEGKNLYHYKAPSDEEYRKALKELNG